MHKEELRRKIFIITSSMFWLAEIVGRKMSMVLCHSDPDLLTDIVRPYYHQVIVVKNKPHRKHLSSSLDFVTTYKEIRTNSFILIVPIYSKGEK